MLDVAYGNLLDEDWQGFDRFEHAGDLRHPVPLPEGVSCYAIAANVGKKAGDLFGDGMVPADSALGRHEDPGLTLAFAPSGQWVGYGMNHLELLSRPSVYEQTPTLDRIPTQAFSQGTSQSVMAVSSYEPGSRGHRTRDNCIRSSSDTRYIW